MPRYSDSTLMSFTKKQLINQLRCAEHNEKTANEFLERHLKAVEKYEPVVHGYWYFSEYEFFSCSVCGFSYYNGCNSTKEAEDRLKNKDDVYAYCPHCGARMDGSKDAEIH